MLEVILLPPHALLVDIKCHSDKDTAAWDVTLYALPHYRDKARAVITAALRSKYMIELQVLKAR